MHAYISISYVVAIQTIDTMLPWKNIHTIFVYYIPKKVRNLTELPVTESQIISRTMLKSYTAAASCARYRFGKSVKKLPEPVTVQSIQTDGKNYQFFVFQLNSLDTDDLSTRNFWYTLPSSTLYEKAQYDNGRPIVEGYNPEVFRRIVAFYRNGS
jgi:large subunit ribosomal protein L37